MSNIWIKVYKIINDERELIKLILKGSYLSLLLKAMVVRVGKKYERIKARYEDRVLFITVPKSMKSKVRQVNIE